MPIFKEHFTHDVNKLERAKAQVETVSLKLGSIDGPNYLSIENITDDEEYLKRLREIIEIRRNIKTKTLPILNRDLDAARLIGASKLPPIHSDFFVLPNGMEARGRVAQVLNAVSGATKDQLITSDQIADEIWPDLTIEAARNNLSVNIDRARSLGKTSGFEIISNLLGNRNRGAAYYSEFKRVCPLVLPTKEAASPEIEAPRDIEIPEFGPLSKVDVAILTNNLKMNHIKINYFLEKEKITPLGPKVLENLVGIIGDVSILPPTLKNAEDRKNKLLKMRLQAISRVKELLYDPDFGKIADEIFEKNDNVWELVVHLDDLKSKIEKTRSIKDGMEYFERLVLNPSSIGFVIDVKAGTVMGVVHTDPGITPTRTPEQKPPVVITDETEAKKRLQEEEFEKVWERLLEEDAASSQVKEPGLESTPRYKAEPFVPGPKAVERRDPDIRKKLNVYLDDILTRDEFNGKLTGMGINRIYPRLGGKFVDDVIDHNWIKIKKVPTDEKGARFDRVATASLLYQYDHGDGLQPKMRRQIQQIAEEELAKRPKKNGGNGHKNP